MPGTLPASPELQRKYALRQINCEKITVKCEKKMTEQTKKKTAAYAACIPGKTHILPPEVPEKHHPRDGQ